MKSHDGAADWAGERRSIDGRRSAEGSAGHSEFSNVPRSESPMNKTNNPCGARGLAFIEFAAADPLFLRELFASFGLSLVRQNGSRSKQYWR
ncbi:MAG: hypothetical protein ACJAYU_001401 [Bradymonadia bacterium]